MAHAAGDGRTMPTDNTQRISLNFKLFRERSEAEKSDAFIANLTDVDIVRASWKPGAANSRVTVPGSITAKSDVDLGGELLAGQSYFLAGADGDRFDFEFPDFGKALSKNGSMFKITIV